MSRLIALSAAALVASACLAYAQPDKIRQEVVVNYSDLDLSTEAGARTMLDRIAQAAPAACKHRDGLIDHRRCIAETIANSVASLNAPLVTRLYTESR